MNTIHRNDLNKEIESLMNLKGTPTGENLYRKLKDLGYEYSELGTGRSSYICSHDIEILNITSKYYLNGEFLVFGLCNFEYPKQGRVYRGYVKQIID
ncbi:MAG: hypothetical protein E6300_18300 [Clostridium sp.]|uniref:hypothetical protein n=1 Tax=Clostridium sp. TaxID=1506 RepID=UPI0029084126|nr:hypothetical protein [Clostridium sp.]MDU7150416.1 hypothetical protein [Clostridium sp.]